MLYSNTVPWQASLTKSLTFVFLTTATWTSHHEIYQDCQRSRVWTPGFAACWCVFFFSSLSPLPEGLTYHDEGVGGSYSTQPDISQAEALDEKSSACCCIPTGIFCPLTSTRVESNTDLSQRTNVNGTTVDQPTQAEKRPSHTEAQSRAYFITIAETLS